MTTVAIVGASGLVGEKMAQIVADKLPNCKLMLFGNTSVGQKVCLFGKSHTIQDMSMLTKSRPNFALFMANESVAKEFVPQLTKLDTVCIDNSSAFRMQSDVPLIVPQINGAKIGIAKLIANPNCTTIQVVMALNALKDLGLTKITVATYQSVSGAGRDGLKDLNEKRTYGHLKTFAHPIYDNILGQIGDILPDGTTVEETKMKNECRKILQLQNLDVNSFCARVPVTVGHCAFVNAELASDFTVEDIKHLLKQQKDILLFDTIPQPQVLRHTHFVGVGRITKHNNTVNMFVVADNLLRGAAYNAYQILDIAIKNNTF